MFELALPWVFLLSPLPFLVWWLFPSTTIAMPAAVKLPFFAALQNIIGHERRRFTASRHIFLLSLIWMLLVTALAGPRWVGPPQSLSRDGYNIMLVLDISLSMDTRDMILNGQPTTRLAVVKRTASQFIHDRPNDKIGLILFGERAYLLSPLTHDHTSVISRMDDATAGLAGQATAMGDALGLAVKRLQNVPAQGRMIILLTDGVNNAGVLSPVQAAELARQDGIKVYSIGLGAAVDLQSFDGLFMQMNGGGADLDEKTLRTIATKTGGQYFRATNLQSLQKIYGLINQMATVRQEQATARPQREYYPWPLAGALALLLYLFALRAGLIGRRQIYSQHSVEPA